MRSAYEVLGLSSDASDDQIGEAFRRHAKCLHPDVNKRPTATKEFAELNGAYDILKNAESRRLHDFALAKIPATDAPNDDVDNVIDSFGLKPKGKKKKKKKKRTEEAPAPPQPQTVIHHHVIHHEASAPMPQQQYIQQEYEVPVQQYDRGRGAPDYGQIPDGYDPDDSCGGIF